MSICANQDVDLRCGREADAFRDFSRSTSAIADVDLR
jgi:hypothetical protein